ncbi:ATP-binding cassette domain-containing protein [Crocinitomix catalasitica]|uniref:ATP-binding cassette domain-containing protein n=1 Tax=Crocinitomix catalasitica TaxID=184607 RepID=UPI00047F9C90|nr:ATP-binding cassette domain-containing protein [Crocinitomix catalasitica]
MKLEFKNVLPYPLVDYKHDKQSVWSSEFKIEFPQKVLLNASSGKGKSTFINTVFGLRKDYSGEIIWDGKNIAEFGMNDWTNLRRDTFSVVFQDLQLFPELTIWENLELKNALTNHKTAAEIQVMLSLLGIGDRKDQITKTLSLGQQQRVAIIRALLQPFKLLLMDEPFSHLDENNAALALDLIAAETDMNNAGFILSSLGSTHGFKYDSELKL